jgi:phenylpyruvate tautomerase PptA (4-oxalocrotonate tautomerase family)
VRQQLDIIVVTDVDPGYCDAKTEKALADAIKEAVKQVLGTPKSRTDVVEFEYGDPI